MSNIVLSLQSIVLSLQYPDSMLGFIPLLLLFVASLLLFWYVDRHSLLLVLRSFGLALLRLFVVGLCVWFLWRTDRWWLWVLGVVVLLGVFAFMGWRWRMEWREALSFVMAMFVSVAVVSGSLMVCMPGSLLLPVAMILAAAIYWPLAEAMRAYSASMEHTQSHRIFLLANGATYLESLLPSIRRALRAAVVPLLRHQTTTATLLGPMLFWGMLVAGSTVPTALLYTLLLTCATFVASMLAAVVAVLLTERKAILISLKSCMKSLKSFLKIPS